MKRVVQRKQRKRRVPLPEIAPGDRVFLIDVPTPGEAISPPDEQGDLDVKLGSLRARINVRQIERVEKGTTERTETDDRARRRLPHAAVAVDAAGAGPARADG